MLLPVVVPDQEQNIADARPAEGGSAQATPASGDRVHIEFPGRALVSIGSGASPAMAPLLPGCSVGELHSKHVTSASYDRFSEHGCWSATEHGTIVSTCWSDGDVWFNDERGEPLVRTRYAMPM